MLIGHCITKYCLRDDDCVKLYHDSREGFFREMFHGFTT